MPDFSIPKGVKGGKIKWYRHQSAISPEKNRGMADQYAATLGSMGITVGPATRERYLNGVRGKAEPREPFLGTMARGVEKWERNYLKAMGR